jgi:AraC family transcriptional regulator, regulatory protein of adaptative response / DNA-3-methyladenine glycosylase II
MPGSTLPSTAVCEQARLSRDARFDGLFYTAVRSTGIYCRPVCPAPPPKPRNVSYYPSAAAAEADGFRPCLRCRPELSPAQGSWRRGDSLLARALELVAHGALDEAPLAALAARLHIGERQLRRIFVDQLGAAPLSVRSTQRLLFAKQLLTETRISITECALAAGFGSLRRFNAAFLEAYGMPPSALRKRAGADAGSAEALVLRLSYRPPFDFETLLDFLRVRALPGLERVDARSYSRLIGGVAAPGWLRISRWPQGSGEPAHALRLELQGVPAAALQDCVRRVRRMFDLDADPTAIEQVLRVDPRLEPLLAARPGLRLPSGFDGFEIAVRAVIGQQVSVAAARTLSARLLQRCGTPVSASLAAHGFSHLFPKAEQLVQADLDGLGLTAARIRSLKAIASALLKGQVSLCPGQVLDKFVAQWIALPGIGPWTAHYLALRALGHPDALPAEDLVLQKTLDPGTRSSARTLQARAESWRPWRSYAVLHLWRSAAEVDATAKAAVADTAAPQPHRPRKRICR